MKYGYFDDNKREYIITNPKTPVKWTNYVGTLSFGGIVDQTGGSLICKGDPALNRITKYIPQLPGSDFKGETLYIRFKDENGKIKRIPFGRDAILVGIENMGTADANQKIRLSPRKKNLKASIMSMFAPLPMGKSSLPKV